MIDQAGAGSRRPPRVFDGKQGVNTQRWAMGLEYDGGEFLGWQRLGHGSSVQSSLEDALSSVAASPVQVQCAGRTDSGVHARCQVVHFDTSVQRDARSWVLGANSRTPRSIAVHWAVPVPDAFHARYSARARRYVYRLLNRPIRPALNRQYLSWEARHLNAAAMNRAAQVLVGEHDFSAFRAQACQANHARRNLHAIEVTREPGEVVSIDVQANAFLHHMIRNIVGSLLLVGRGERAESWLGEVLAGRRRDVAGPTAPAAGLTFIGPMYPASWGLPAEATLTPEWETGE